ncbi:MAG: hypothetical protein ACI94Y_003518 [Maribacter sp.]|jgi:hypothetical protein
MKNIYLTLAIIGFISPNVLVFIESFDSGNILLYSNPTATIEAMFANRVSTIFMIDLLFALLVFFIWSYSEKKKYGIKNIGIVWLLTMLLGLAGGLPLFLYLKEKKYP